MICQECLYFGLRFLCRCMFCAGLSTRWCYKPLNSFKTAAHITFWHALIISPLLSVPGLFIGKTDVVKEGKKKEPTNNIKAKYEFLSLPVILAINNTICWFFPKINFLRIYYSFSCVRWKYRLQFAFFLITGEGEHFLAMCLLLFRWIAHTYFVHYPFLGFLYWLLSTWISSKDTPCLCLRFWICL